MEAISARVNSFKKAKRVKNADKPSSTTSLKWPHPPDFKANPETLAEAGFYYDPAYDDPDNVTCYICSKELGGWEEDDDPFLLHWVKCGQRCCWASVRCGLSADVDQSGRFIASDKTRNPTHKLMEKARLDTFHVGKGWIHDQATVHGASSVMMARAGFVYTPQHSGDDLATCLYCGISLSGWDADDDPMDEHRKRAAKQDLHCAFFQALEPSSRSQSTKPPSKAQSKPASRSTSKSKYQDAVVPTKTFDGQEDESDAVEPAKPAKSTAKTPRKPRSTSSSATKKSTAKTPKAKSRSTSRTGLKDVAEDEEEDTEIEVPKTVKNKTHSRSKSGIKSDVQTDYDEGAEVQAPRTVKKSRAPSKSVAKAEEAMIDDEDNAKPEPPQTVKKKTKAQAKSAIKTGVEVDTEDGLAEISKPARKARKPVQESADEVEEDVPRKSSRAKAKASVVPDTDDAPRKASRSKAKPSVASATTELPARKASRTKSKKVPDSEQDVIEESESDARPKPAAKPRHQRVASKTGSTAPIVVSETESVHHEEKIIDAAPKKKARSTKTKPPSRPVDLKDVFNEDVAMDSDTEVAPVPSFPSPSDSTSAAELSTLFVPKRRNAAATSNTGSSKPPSQPQSKAKAAPPPKPTSQPPKNMKVVEISSDEESDRNDVQGDRHKHDGPLVEKGSVVKSQVFAQPEFITPPKPAATSQGKRKKSITVEIIQPVAKTHSYSPPAHEPMNDNDVNMDHSEPEADNHMDDVPPPSTPPRPTTYPARSVNETQDKVTRPISEFPSSSSNSLQSAPPLAPTEPPFTPPLSKLPFTPLHSLTDAELDMTVEEWIRYQMDVEFDKFRRDGERELQQFRKKAEDVRRIIEGL